MNEGYYLSVYTHIDELAHIHHIDLRHDHHMALWKKEGVHITLIHYWEFERSSGMKHHNQSFYNLAHAKSVINALLGEEGLTLKDMVQVFGTPELDTVYNYFTPQEEPAIAYHSVAHLYSALTMDSDKFYNSRIIAIAADGGPDNVVDQHARDKDFYVGAYSEYGKISLFTVPSPGILWMFMKLRYSMEEGSLMALGSASESCCHIQMENWMKGFHPIKNENDILPAFHWFENIARTVEAIQDTDEGRLFNKWDSRFSRRENIISMVTKIVQELSILLMRNTVQEIVDDYHVKTRDTYLALAGGFSLNCPTNTYLMDEFHFKGLLVPPCVSDTGIALGMGLHAFYHGMDTVHFKLLHAYYGNRNSMDTASLKAGKFHPFIKTITPLEMDLIAADIECGPVVWVSGRAEIGPRALGARSILANPANMEHKNLLNQIKEREWWRPVAPIVLQECVRDWFIEDCATPYMLTTMHVAEEKRKLVPAIQHLDGTARVQLVSEQEDYILYSLLKSFYKRTGIPILCNTSLNDKGEPIIDNYTQALNFALRKKIPVVYLDGYRIVLHRFEEFTQTCPEKRNSMFEYFHSEAEKQQKEHELNPFGLSRDELILYYNSPELKSFDLRIPKQVEQFRRIASKFQKRSLQQIKLTYEL